MKQMLNKFWLFLTSPTSSLSRFCAIVIIVCLVTIISSWIFSRPVSISNPSYPTNFTQALQNLGFDYASHRPLGDGYALVTLGDNRKIVVYTPGLLSPTLSTLFFAGAISTRTGTDQIADVAAFHGAMPPAQVLEMILRAKSSAPEASPGSREAVSSIPLTQGNIAGPPGSLREPYVAPVPTFTAQEFQEVLASPGKSLFPDRGIDPASTLVMFTWMDCPSCVRMHHYFETQKDRIAFQVLFVPVAGDQSLDASALAYLGLTNAEPSVQEEVLTHLRRTSDILGSRLGKILVPAFAWQDDQGEARIGNLVAVQWRELTSRLNSGAALP